DQHAGAVDDRAVSNRIADAGGFEPSPPGLPVAETQQRKLQYVRGRGDAVASRHEPGAANRKKLLGAEAHDVEPGPIAVAVTNRKVDVVTHEVDVMRRGGTPEIDFPMALGKPAEPMHQPFGGKIRRGADGEDSGAAALHQALRA